MTREIEVLHKIFELELAPPFKLETSDNILTTPRIINKHMVHIGWYYSMSSIVELTFAVETPMLSKIRRTFNVDKYSGDDIYHIAKHLYYWLQGNLTVEIVAVDVIDAETAIAKRYPKP